MFFLAKILSSIFKEKWSEAWRMLQIIFEMSKDPFLGESISLVDSIADQRSADRLRLWIKNGLNSGMITHFAQLIMLEREIVKYEYVFIILLCLFRILIFFREFYDASSIFRGRVDEWENFLLGLSSISHLKFSFALSPLLNKSSSFDEIASSCVNTENTSNIAYPELISNNEESASSVNHAKSSVRRFSLMSNKYSSESMNDEEKSVEYFESRMQDLAMTIGENSDLSLCGDSGLSDIFGVHKTCSSLDDLNHLINDFSDSKPVIGSAKEEIESHKDVVFPSDPLPRVQSENMQTESEAKAPANIESLTLKKDSAVISDISSDSIPILFKNIDTCNSSLNSNVYSGDHIELNLKRVPKTPDPNLLQNQNEKCASCGNAIGRTLWINFCRYCTYIGKLYCMKCHRNEFSIIPGLLINDLDIREYPVCVLAKRFLSSMNSFPVIPLSSIRKNFPDEPVLEEMQNLRRRISLMWGYIRDCKKATRITRILGDRSYLLINDDMFSIKDIARFLSKDGSTLIKAIADSLGQHILSDCAHCTSKGSTCLYCQSPDLIYSFQSESAVQCRRCMGVYHRSCFNRLNCPTCKSNIPNKS